MSKKFLVLITVVLCVVILGVWFSVIPSHNLPEFLNFDTQNNFNKMESDKSEYDPVDTTIMYHPADFSENIYDDEAYLELIGPYVMHYKKDDVERSLTYSELESCGVWAEFFYDFIEDIKNGDNTAYNSYFFDDYFKNHLKMNEFTMQKIYDLRIEELDVNIKLDETEYSWVTENALEPMYFNVKYKIRQNNGSFRLGVSSDTYQPQLYILALDKNNNVKIIDIVAWSNS